MRIAWLLVVIAACGGGPSAPWAKVPAADLPARVHEIQPAMWNGWTIEVTETAALTDTGCPGDVCRRIDGLVCSGPDVDDGTPCALKLVENVEQGYTTCELEMSDGQSLEIACPTRVVL